MFTRAKAGAVKGAEVEAQRVGYERAVQEAERAVAAFDEAHEDFAAKVIPSVEAWMERFSTHKTIYELEDVVAQVKAAQTLAATREGRPGAGAVIAGGAVIGGVAGGVSVGGAGAAAVGASSVLLPIGVVVGGLLFVGGIAWAIRRARRASAQRRVEVVDDHLDQLGEAQEALRGLAQRASALRAALLEVRAEAEAALRELSTVSHLYVQYWTYRQRQALSDLMASFKRYKKILEEELVLPEAL